MFGGEATDVVGNSAVSHTDPQEATRAFEAKVSGLIAATRTLDIPRILILRRMTLADPEVRKWASEKQINVIFSVILSKASERFGLSRLKVARDQNFVPLLPADPANRDEDLRVIAEIVTQLLGPPEMSEAEAAHAGFLALFGRKLVPSPGRVPRIQTPVREPPPLFAAQLGATTDRRQTLGLPAVVGGGGAAPTATVDFATLFDETLCAYAQKTLTMFRIGAPSRGIRLPFLLAPEFGPVYREVLKRHILPQMRATRHIQALAQSCNWADVGGDRLIEIIQGSEVNNPILHNWDARWAAFRAPKPGRGRAKPAPLRPEDDPWPMLREEAMRSRFIPPTEDDLPLLRDIIRFESEVMARCWRELGQLYTQEFNPNAQMDQAREGALRDGIIKWIAKMPDHVGEHLAIKTLFEFEKIDVAWLRNLLSSFGRTDSERRRNVPYLADFVVQLY